MQPKVAFNSMCDSDWPWTPDLPASTSQVLGFQVWAALPGLVGFLSTIHSSSPLSSHNSYDVWVLSFSQLTDKQLGDIQSLTQGHTVNCNCRIGVQFSSCKEYDCQPHAYNSWSHWAGRACPTIFPHCPIDDSFLLCQHMSPWLQSHWYMLRWLFFIFVLAFSTPCMLG